MKLHIYSDLHLETNDSLCRYSNSLRNTANADILIYAGDTCDGFPNKEYIEYLKSRFEEYKYVIYIIGNHEYYHEIFNDDFTLRLQNEFNKNVFVISKFTIINITDTFGIVCGTMWSHIDPKKHLNISRIIDDYKCIRIDEKTRFSPNDSTQEYWRFNNELINTKLPKNFIVVTHHSPSFKSVHKRYENSLINDAFSSNLDNLILDIKPMIWVHGHHHDSSAYMIGNTRILCNPYGYYAQNNRFNTKLFIDLENI